MPMLDSLRSEPHYERLLAKLGSIADLTDDQQAAIRNLPARVRHLRAHEDIVMEGDRPTECCLLLEGFACRYKLLPDARRQILSFHIPGDIPDVQSLHLKRMDHSLSVLLPSRVALIPHAALRKLTHDHPPLADIFWRDTLIDAAVFREWMVGMGRRSALARIAHLFCELVVRLRAVHLVSNDSITLRLTQAELGDALGLSTVHVNRVLQRLRGDGIISLHAGLLRVLDWPALVAVGEFSPDYLHFET
jgi:CRP-like cAMP-binding protein